MNKVTNTTSRVKSDPMLALFENMLPNAIERSEKQGQIELCQSEILPIRFSRGNQTDLEAAGVVFGEKVDGDPIFQHVTLPKGWKIQSTEHSMWTELIDEKGRHRASIFYKAAFYDRHSHISLSTRYNYSVYENKKYAVVKDGDKIIWQSKPFDLGEFDGEPTWYSQDKRAKEAEEYLNKNYPDWQDVKVYWDQS